MIDDSVRMLTIGGYEITATGAMHLTSSRQLEKYDLLVDLSNGKREVDPPADATLIEVAWQDYSPPPENIGETIEAVAQSLAEGKRVIVFCYAGLGRTGTFLAMLLAKLEPEVNDPVAEIRRRYREEAVETQGQEQAVREYRTKLLAAAKGD